MDSAGGERGPRREGLAGRVALVTGAGRGIGKAIVLRFSEEGAKVVVSDVDFSYAQVVAEVLRRKGREALAIRADVTNREEVESMFEEATRQLGTVDILVNNAGVRRDIPFPKMSQDEWDSIIAVQLRGSFNCAQVAQRYMAARGYGRIINLSSPVPGAWGQGEASYSTASAGVQGLTKALAIELGKFGITVNCIAPEFIETDMTRQSARRRGMYPHDLKGFAEALIPLRRLGTAAEVAHVALFLASDEASFVTGQVICVRGGP